MTGVPCVLSLFCSHCLFFFFCLFLLWLARLSAALCYRGCLQAKHSIPFCLHALEFTFSSDRVNTSLREESWQLFVSFPQRSPFPLQNWEIKVMSHSNQNYIFRSPQPLWLSWILIIIPASWLGDFSPLPCQYVVCALNRLLQ